MKIRDQEYFERLYSERDPWTPRVDEMLSNHAEKLKQGTVLDLGAGDGRNSILLAERFKVVAVDFSQTAIDKLLARAKAKGVEGLITPVVSDIRNFNFEGSYDNTVCSFVLHFLSQVEGEKLIDRIMDHTPAGGTNVITDFSRNIELSGDDGGYWTTLEEISSFYSGKGWEVVIAQPGQAKTMHSDVPIDTFGIIAQKPI